MYMRSRGPPAGENPQSGGIGRDEDASPPVDSSCVGEIGPRSRMYFWFVGFLPRATPVSRKIRCDFNLNSHRGRLASGADCPDPPPTPWVGAGRK